MKRNMHMNAQKYSVPAGRRRFITILPVGHHNFEVLYKRKKIHVGEYRD
jgi:hypothetical protein